jgi:hypothetical protein
MKTICLALAALLCLPILGLAVPDSAITGPYNVSFDLGNPKESYLVNVSAPKTTESLGGDIHTAYGIRIFDMRSPNKKAAIVIAEYQEDQTMYSPAEMKTILRYMMDGEQDVSDIQSDNRVIDGFNGGISSGERMGADGVPFYEYMAVYQMTPRLQTTLVSSYPWEEGTLSLLKTVHIEKINSTA